MKMTRETRVRRERTVVYHSQGHSTVAVHTLIRQRPLTSVSPLDLFSLCELKTKACHKLNQATLQKYLGPSYKIVSCTVRAASPSFHFNLEPHFNPSALSFHGRRAFHFNGLVLTCFCVKNLNLKANKQSLLQVQLSRYNHFSFYQWKSLVLLVKTAPANLKARANFQHCTNT